MAVDVLHVESIRASDVSLCVSSSTEGTAEVVANETQPTTQAEAAIEHDEAKVNQAFHQSFPVSGESVRPSVSHDTL